MRNPLQEQLLKAGLVKKGKVAQVVREQVKARHGKQATKAPTLSDAERARQEKIERDRALAQARNEELRQRELRAQARQMMLDGLVEGAGDRAYRFNVDGAIRSLLVSDAQARQIAEGGLVIARLEARFVLLPRALGLRVAERDGSAIVVDHGAGVDRDEDVDDAYDDPKFAIPDDLVW